MPGMPGNIVKGPILKAFDHFANNNQAKHSGRRGAEVMLEFYEQHANIKDWVDEAVQGGPNSNKWPILRKQFTRSADAPPEDDSLHVLRHWFGFKNTSARKPRNVWWPDLHPMDRVFKQGLKEALRRCLYVSGSATSGVVDFDDVQNEIVRTDGKTWDLQPNDKIRVWGSRNNDGEKTVAAATTTTAVRVTDALNPEASSPAIVYVVRPTPLPVDSYWVCAGSHYELIAAESDHQITLLIFTPSVRFSRTQGRFQAGSTPVPADYDRIWVTKSGGGSSLGEEPIHVPGGNEDGVHTVQLKVQDITDLHDDL